MPIASRKPSVAGIAHTLRRLSQEPCEHDLRVSWGFKDGVLGDICICRFFQVCSDGSMERLIHAMRNGRFEKSELPYITPYGVFGTWDDPRRFSPSGRSEGDWKRASGLVALDLDYLGNSVEASLAAVCRSNEVLGAIRSPSGNGVKVFGRAPGIQSPADTLLVWEQFSDIVAPDLKRSGEPGEKKNDPIQGVATQPLFFTHDPDLYLDWSAPDLPALQLADWVRPERGRIETRDNKHLMWMLAERSGDWTYAQGRQRLGCPGCGHGSSLNLFVHRHGYWWLSCFNRGTCSLDIPETLERIEEVVPEMTKIAPLP